MENGRRKKQVGCFSKLAVRNEGRWQKWFNYNLSKDFLRFSYSQLYQMA